MSLFYPSTPNYANATFPPPREFQSEAHDALRRGFAEGHKNQMLCAPTGAGKCLGRDTPVMMSDGSVKMVQDVVIGDRLMGPDGSYRNVLGVSSGREKLYRITPKKGDSYVVNSSHILSLRKTPGSDGIFLSDGTHIPRDSDIVNINVEVFLNSSDTARHCLKGWRCGAIDSFDRDVEDLLIPPYILGAWLGDGTTKHPAISKPMCNMVKAWIDYGKSLNFSVKKRVSKEGGCPTWFLTKDRGNRLNLFSSAIDLLGCRTRNIPDEYKYASLTDRLELLAGLIDSDGSENNGGCDWISKSEILANDFAFVCRSVGLACYISKQTKRIKSTGFEGEYWRASVSGDLSIIPTKDKKFKQRQQKKRHLVHGISVNSIGFGEYFGFEIDGDHLFLLGDFTVTHNTYLGLRIAHEALLRGKKATFVCDREALINQTSDVSDRYGLSAHGIIKADHWRVDRSMPFQIASAQTLDRRGWPESDVIIVDEAHTQHKVWTNHINQCGAAVIGLSATPFSTGLGKMFTNLVNAATMERLTQEGVLVPMRVFTCARPDMDGAKTVGGEWAQNEAAARGMEIIGDVVLEWSKHAENRKTIIFGANINHCLEIVRQFNEAGIMAAAFTSKTSESERRELLEEYRKEDSFLRVLVSVEALAKGFDVPDVGCVVDCRPLRKSLSTAIQMWGRGLRSHPGKTDCILLDHSGNIIRFADDYSDFFFNGLDALDAGEKLDKAVRRDDKEKEERACPLCGFKPMGRRCVSCGYEKVVQSLVEHFPGELSEITIGKKKYADNAKHLWEQACTYARSHSAPDKQKGRAAHIYRDITGDWPPAHFNFDDTPNVVIGRNVLNKIRSRNIAFAAVRQKETA